MTIQGVYHRTYEEFNSGKKIFCLKKTNITEFDKENPYVKCEGEILHKEAGLPLELEGTYNTITKTFEVDNYNIKTNTKDDIIAFLSMKNITKLGNQKIERIAKVCSNDLFGYIKSHMNAIDDFCNDGIDAQTAEEVVILVSKINEIESIYRYIKKCKGNISKVEYIYNKYGQNSLKMLKSNPYSLLYAGLSFEECELLANSLSIPYFDEKRVHALVNYVLDLNENRGNTKIEINTFFNFIKKIETRQNLYNTNEWIIANELLDNNCYLLSEESDGIYLYKKKTYEYESEIVSHLIRLNKGTVLEPVKKVTIKELENYCQISYSDKQKEAIQLLDTPGVKIITGGPGTGKTTTLNGILTKYELEHPNSKILLCAPTGCASKRMQESTGRAALTIHKALDIRPYMDDEFIAMIKTLEVDCIIIDECSMVDTEMFSILIKSIKNNTQLLLIGDKDQLSSVGCGNVFGDLLESNYITSCELDVNYRQGQNNSIIYNANQINKGNTSLKTDKQTIIRRHKTEKEMLEDIVNTYLDMYDAAHPQDTKIYTLTRKKYLTSSISLNNLIKEHLNPINNNPYFYANGYTFTENDLIIMNRNNYEKGYYNGDQGVITDIYIHGFTKKITIEIDGNEIELTNKDLKDIELAYAITTHKSQGAECKNAIIVVPENPIVLLSRKIIYVATTRAKKKNIIITQKKALETAINNKYDKARSTGLNEKIQKIM